MSTLQLTAAQRAVVENRGGSLLVSAAAGSGKTKVLVERLFRYVTEENCNVDDFLIITYTKAAAAELRNKIAEELSARLAEKPGDAAKYIIALVSMGYDPTQLMDQKKKFKYWIHMQKNEIESLFYIICKSQLKIDYRLNVRPKTVTVLEENRRKAS